jgi:hypothetical protein
MNIESIFQTGAPYVVGWILLTIPFYVSIQVIEYSRSKKSRAASINAKIWGYLKTIIVCFCVSVFLNQVKFNERLVVFSILIGLSGTIGTYVGYEKESKFSPKYKERIRIELEKSSKYNDEYK